MRIRYFCKAFNRNDFRTGGIGSTGGSVSSERFSAGALFLLAAAATLTISIRGPFPSWGYEFGVFLLGTLWMLRTLARPRPVGVTAVGLALVAIATWGFFQLALGATVYRYGTVEASLRMAALGGSALVAACALGNAHVRLAFLRGFAWFGFLVSVAGVLAYHTSPGKILWSFPSPFPDVWGPFLSRNNFAQFLELTLPAALWLALQGDRPRRLVYTIMAAAMLAAGLASASRAGAALLVLETMAAFGMLRQSRAWRPMMLQLAAATAALVAVTGAGTLASRLREPNPMEYRRKIARSTLEMIAAHPWRGHGLGTFATVYPAYATFDAGAIVDHAHNDWLEWASEGGLPFAAAWAVLALATALPAIRSVWGLGILAALLHALVDYPFARFGVAAWTFALLGALHGPRGEFS
jgi:O-antigen ligase